MMSGPVEQLQICRNVIEEAGIEKSHACRGITVDHYLNPSVRQDWQRIKYYSRVSLSRDRGGGGAGGGFPPHFLDG